ncbi:phosphatidylserine decarboxylase-domain-containing protein [Cantharellus anzutake]|uniref:phosphatidylserine decarboxylase-domain-containing protein n=1 Tax=Cantharellus anzutake TaxID=1750568 RepID=UPI001908955E|nr:phosphatidylserine decarboxylase-domain-containing protein [Cantharellus anzutake]KAF8329114.1 phosphatidylserine decarboxylase-domain-containing protein [Cantharellus anzutake]
MPKFHFRRRLMPFPGALRPSRRVFSPRRWYPVRYFSRQSNLHEASDSAPMTTSQNKIPLRRRLAAAWKETPTVWYPLPIGVGALLLAMLSWRNNTRREAGETEAGQPVGAKRRWQVHVLGALPLRNLSRVWGYLNSFELPIWLRPVGLQFYAWLFGCNLDETEHSDLTRYRSLGEFFYRRLKPGVRPLADAVLVSPADGTVLHFGKIVNSRVEQVKGLTYSLDAFLGTRQAGDSVNVDFAERQGAEVDDEEFANVNGIEYSLNQLLGSTSQKSPNSTPSSSSSTLLCPSTNTATREGDVEDASVPEEATTPDTLSVAAEVGTVATHPGLQRSMTVSNVKPGNELFFTVIYLAPGDYHRFHSPTAWVVEKRRHFTGELFSVAPWLAKRLADLFVLNERVALLGKWRYGFFSMIPVGATNVGSIRINFDEALRTNVRGGRHKVSPGSFHEAIYTNASIILRGHPLRPGQEMGGFMLGSTIVLVFEAPTTFKFEIQAGQRVKVGEKVGDVPNLV